MPTDHLKRGIAILLILGQIAGIVVARFLPERYFSWAPYEEVTLYEIKASVDFKNLSPHEILERYGLTPVGRQDRSIHNVISILRWREKQDGQESQVILTYSTNGGPQHVWQWPEDKITSSD
ncbi:MAG: hypothetical protein KJT03_10895 [Verrucomicrobiae bacterium]|nr:hypothetical protein [Verrucomicrobiae bacterium]